MGKLTPRERIAKARINLTTDYPFYGSLCMKLVPKELTQEEAQMYNIPAMAVDMYGNLIYNPQWVEQQTDSVLKAAVCHEVMHVALKHLVRVGTRDPRIWNIATDATINEILSHTFKLPDNWVHIPEMAKKSAEEIYDFLMKNAELVKSGRYGEGFDTHIFAKGDGSECGGSSSKGKQFKDGGVGNENSPFFKEGQQPFDATRAIREAYNFAKQQGKVPAGIERQFADILNPQLDWKDILRKFIVAIVPHDFTYTRPSKKSYSVGYYMPMVKKETVELVIAVDSSGSISEEEYAEFLSEIYAMVKQFESVKGTLIICDADVQNVIEIDQNFDPYSIKGRGYGGTDARPVYNYIEKEMSAQNVKLLVYFTDGWITIPEKDYTFHTLWIITKHGRTDEVEKMPNATVIQIPKNGADD